LSVERIVRGSVRGKTIELHEDLGLADGQEVEITVRTIPKPAARQPGEGLLRTEDRGRGRVASVVGRAARQNGMAVRASG
jgi:hypothetical protein